MKETKIFF